MAISFTEIENAAINRMGGRDSLEARMADEPKSRAELAAIPSDRYLSAMAEVIFCAGFSWKVVHKKWPGIEEAFHNFNPARVAFIHDEELDALLQDTRIIRHAKKVQAIINNARILADMDRDAKDGAGPSFGQFLADWPEDDPIGLWKEIKKRFNQLGGNSGAYFTRFMGKDVFMFSGDVTRCLQLMCGLEDTRTVKQRKAAQALFNDWKAETGYSFNRLSRIAAFATDGPKDVV